MEVKFKPAKGYILLELKKIKDTTDTGIILAKSQIEELKQKKDDFLKVIAIHKDSEYKLGDEVLISGYSIVELDGEEYALGHEVHILGTKC